MKPRSAKRSNVARVSDTVELRARLQEAESRLRALEERHDLAMGAIRESVYDYDVVRDSIFYSDSMQRELGLPPGTLRTPQDWRDRIHPEDLPRYREAFVGHLKGLTERFLCDYRYRGADGTWRWARQHGLAVRGKDGRAIRVVGSTGDITDLKRTEEAFEQVRGRYDLALRAINEGVYEWDIANGTAYFSDRLYEVLNLTPDDFTGPMDWRNRIHPQDLPSYDAALVAHFKGHRERFECEYRYKAHDGSWRWARQHGLAVRDASGRAVRMTGSAGDITDLKRAEQALRTSEERYALATEAAVEGIYEWDIGSGKLYLTLRAKEFFAVSGEDLTPTAWNVRVHAEDYAGYRAAIVEHFKGRTPHLEIEYRIADGSGGYRWVLDRGKAVRNAEGRAIRMVGALSDITQRKRSELELRRARDEATEALEQQTATAEILRAMSRSLTDLAPVFDTILQNMLTLCEGDVAALWRYDGSHLRFAAHRGGSEQGAAYLREHPLELGDYNPTPQAGLEHRPVHVLDVFAEPRYRPLVPLDMFRSVPNSGTVLAIPLLREDTLLGVITIWRHHKRMFNEKQIAMVNTFAAQAVIAIENVRLFNETQEALERQTATGEILRVISSSPTDTQPVFDAIVQSGLKLFPGAAIAVALPEGDKVCVAAIAESDPARAAAWKERFPFPLTREYMHGAVILDCRVVDVPDARDAPPGMEAGCTNFLASGYRAATMMPMTRRHAAIGAISVLRQSPGALSDKQLALLKTFADQAVIAIENVRLFNETKEALEQQTAISDILRVISGSPGEVTPMLDAVAERAVKLCESGEAGIFLREGDRLRFAAGCQTGVTFKPGEAIPLTRGSVLGRALIDREAVHIVDLAAAPVEEFPLARQYQKRFGHRSIVAVPLMREDRAIGVIGLWRFEVRAFSEKHIALVRTFADQAAIAIENVRLFNETNEALEQLKASAEILRAISSSIADTAPVFDKILESCERLFAGRIVGLNLVEDDGLLHIGAYHGSYREEFERIFPLPVSRESGSGLSIVERRVVHYPDTEHGEGVPAKTRQGCKAIGIKSAIFAPMLWEGRGIGAIFVGRDHVSSFAQKEITLLKTFADQAVIAIQNARLFREINEKSRQLEVANRHKSEFLANMSHELRTPLNAIIGFTRIVLRRSKAQLEAKQYENLEKILSSGQHLLQLINAILDLAKVEAGRVEVNAAEVALASVLEQCVKTVEPLVKADAVRLVREFDGELPQVYTDEEKLRQIVINLLSNAVKFTERGTVRVQAGRNGATFSVAVRDTGIGIPGDKLEHVFEEFAQADASSTRVYGGTGLGLTIARRLARLMGGDIAVQSAPGAGSTFTLTLPVRYHG